MWREARSLSRTLHVSVWTAPHAREETLEDLRDDVLRDYIAGNEVSSRAMVDCGQQFVFWMMEIDYPNPERGIRFLSINMVTYIGAER